LPIEPGALYVLAAKRTPDDVIELAIERALAGEVITQAKAKALISGALMSLNGRAMAESYDFVADQLGSHVGTHAVGIDTCQPHEQIIEVKPEMVIKMHSATQRHRYRHTLASEMTEKKFIIVESSSLAIWIDASRETRIPQHDIDFAIGLILPTAIPDND
jgi:hypothetical protein